MNMHLLAKIGLVGMTIAAQEPATADFRAPYYRCQSQVLNVQADLLEGKLFDSAGAVKRFETANPDYTLDSVTFKLAQKPKPLHP